MVHRMLFWRKTDSLFYHLLSVYLNPNPILRKNTNVFKCQLFFSKMFEDSRCIFAMSDNEFLSGEENGEERELASCFLQSPIREVQLSRAISRKWFKLSLQVCKFARHAFSSITKDGELIINFHEQLSRY